MQSQGVVIDSIANLYSKPNKAADLVTQAILGTDLSIEQSKDGWHYVRMPDEYQGWIEPSHVRLYVKGEAPYASAGLVTEIQNLFAFLYHEPSVSTRAPVLQVTLGARLEVARQHESWVEVALPDGPVRWVQKGDVTLSAADARRPRGSTQQVIHTAKRFLGLPYLWGGTTPLGIDCSAFVQLVYRLNGVHLLRDADIQYTQPGLAHVGRKDLQAGDLLFFGQERITHVGMDIGDGEFIHATTHRLPVVQISRLEEAHWTGRYRGARRP
jgi:cell wall-associated NlpC family hydrolase